MDTLEDEKTTSKTLAVNVLIDFLAAIKSNIFIYIYIYIFPIEIDNNPPYTWQTCSGGDRSRSSFTNLHNIYVIIMTLKVDKDTIRVN